MKRKTRRPVKRHARKRTSKEVTRRQAAGDSVSPTLGDNIKRARTASGMTQLALAHAIGYLGDDAGAYISRVESDHQAPRIDTLQRIADALGVPVCSLLAKT
jgi:ribosome-binding protein aMBF1 (putative translation factor)